MPGHRPWFPADVDIDIYSDVVCPWCYIGKRRFEQALSGFDREVTVTYRPFQLDPDTPRGPHPLIDWLGPKFGGEERARQVTAHTTRVAAADGIEMRFDTAVIANSFDAHRLIWFATRAGAGPAVVEALHKAHFTDGQDIGSPDVLTSIAAGAGLEAATVRAFLDSAEGVAEVRAAVDEAYRLGIHSVPTFVFAGKYAVSGAQDPAQLLAVLEEVARREAADPPLTQVGTPDPTREEDARTRP
jgi:predicted DsbA family dithiol-disulfide isomerase